MPEVTKFHYNASGSIRRIKHKEFGSATYTNSEIYVHNEEQLLMGYNDSVANTFAHFVYDHTGNRILKGGLGAAIASTNGQATATSFVVDPYTTYANAYYVEQPYSTVSTISKHYYMGMQRIATNLGGTEVIEEPGGEPGMEKTNQTGNNAVVNNLIEVLANFGATEGTDYTREQITQTPNFTDYYPQDSSMHTPTQAMKNGTTSSTNSLPFGEGRGGVSAPEEPGNEMPSARLLYYYHPDYLGNVEYTTDASGMPYQYFFYSPWGEPLADQKANTNVNRDSPYTFNGKELDEETGLYYYGARYYNPQVSVWLGVDPLAMDGDNLTRSPFNFTDNNPINAIDPDGRNPIYDTDGNFLGTDDAGLKGQMIIMEASDFTQGMSNADAMSVSLDVSALSWNSDGSARSMSETNSIMDNMTKHFKGLSGRPDYDGIVTLEEAQEWRKTGKGQPLYVDFSKFKFTSSNLVVGDIGESGEQYVNFFHSFNIHAGDKNVIWKPASDETLSDVYGTVKIKLLDRSNGTVIIPPFNKAGYFDTYDFKGLAKSIRGSGDDFGFIGYGTGRIKRN